MPCLRTVSPVAISSRRARSANASMPIAANMSWAVRSCSRASTRGLRGAATPRTAGAHGRAPDEPGCGPAGRSPRGTARRRPPRRSATPGSGPRCRARHRCRRPASTPPAARAHRGRASVSPLRAAASISSGSIHMVWNGTRHSEMACRAADCRLVVAGEAVVQDRGRPMRVDRRDTLPSGGELDRGRDQCGGLCFPALKGPELLPCLEGPGAASCEGASARCRARWDSRSPPPRCRSLR